MTSQSSLCFSWNSIAMTRPYAEVIGDPIVQSKSPAIHSFWLAGLGIDADYRAAHIRPEELADYLALRRDDAQWRGCNVTMPHKQAVIPLLDSIDPLAARIGAVNTIARGADGVLTGFNTDAPGFLEPLGDWRPHSAIIVGAGGAARAILLALADSGVRQVSILNRNVARAQDLLAEFGLDGMAASLETVLPAADLLVNSSSLGMTGHPPLPSRLLESVTPDGTVYDIVTSPADTALLQAARASGRKVIDGLAMLIGQADHAFAHFFHQHPPHSADGALRSAIAG